jgi:hypothetical protein
VTRDEVWGTYVEAMALLAKAEQQTAEVREALERAEADEVALRRAIDEARDTLEALARREAGGTWVSFDEWASKRDETPAAADTLRVITAARTNGHLDAAP